MARNLNGWIRIDRKLSESDIAQRSVETFAVWVHLLLMANYSESKRYVSGSAVKLQPGQLITGVTELSQRSGATPNKVRGALEYLKITGRITDEPNQKGRVISIVKWSEYQLDHEQDHVQVTDNSRADHAQITDESRTDHVQPTPSEQRNNPTTEPGNQGTREQGTLFPVPDPVPPKKPKKPKVDVTPEEEALRKAVREAYADAIEKRWHSKATFNATVHSQVAQLVKRLGQDAPDVVRFYVLHNDGFYVKKCHPIGLCLKDAEALHIQWQKGKHITSNMVRDFEKSDAFQERLKQMEKI